MTPLSGDPPALAVSGTTPNPVMIPEAQYNVARDGYFEALRLRDEARAEAQRLREAIVDALADLTPGIAPHNLLTRALTGESL